MTTAAAPPILSLVLLAPLVSAPGLALAPGGLSPVWLRRLSLAVLTVQLLLMVAVLFRFDPTTGRMQLLEQVPWLGALGLDYRLGVDGLSLPLLLINGTLSLVAVAISPLTTPRPRSYFALLLLISGAVNGAFLAQNLLLFFLFYELELIPLWLLIAIWGGAGRAYAATKFLIFTAVSGVLILVGFLGLALATGSLDFSLNPALSQQLGLGTQLFLMGALLVGFGIKIPLFPFHSWLPDAHTEASTPISVLLAGVLLKLGTYGLLRFCLSLFPQAWAVLAPGLAGWAAVSVLFGSLAAIAQTDMKRMVAYSSVGHMGYVLLAAAAATPISLLGSLLQMLAHGLISGLMFLLVGVIYQTTGTRDLTILRGLLNPQRGLPLTGGLMILAAMASAGIPGMAGFVAELMVFRGSLLTFPLATLLSMVGSGLTAVYFLLLVNRAFFGRLATEPGGKPPALLPLAGFVQQVPAVVLAAVVVVMGLWPQGLANLAVASTSALGQPTGGPLADIAMAGTGQPPASGLLLEETAHGGR
ncbi:NADH-quinone oxidoreductase subunit M [Candidatus Synechococcus spongiarum]|uniref:NADH-quinone oxidoreductase subunit M n=1 Tax=Candidatus Synechococcus spongiarum TaxID=431041 RepID=UPI0009930CF2|nr:NADH-quinone oxidoreductase subunit M [Candidatus Synechococcus spongiarum]